MIETFALSYQITLEEPALLTSLSGDPNSAVSLSYLPGSVLRGAAVAAWLSAHPNRTGDLDADADVRRLFLDGTTRFLNGYPMTASGARALPTPLSWHQNKSEAMRQCEDRDTWAPMYDFACEGSDMEEARESGEAYIGNNSPFYARIDKSSVYLCSPERQVAVHTQRTPRFGRAMPKDKIEADETPGAVYRFDALASGQTFQAVILCGVERNALDLIDLLPEGCYWLGGARTGGYGRVRFHDMDARDQWRETNGDLQHEDDTPVDELYITLLSDLLLRDGQGQYVVDAETVRIAVEARLGANAKLELRRAFVRAQPVGGFNRKWGLPLPQALAVQQGSVFVYNASGVTAGQARMLEERGIGERRAEGFGRVGAGTETAWRIGVSTPDKQPVSLHDLTHTQSSPAHVLAQRMANRMLDQRVQERITGRIAEDESWKRNGLNNSQIGRLRAVLREELNKSEPSTHCVVEFLNNLRDRAKKQFDNAFLGQSPRVSLTDWLRDNCGKTSEQEYQTLIGIQGVSRRDDGQESPRDYREVGKVRPEVTDALRHQWVLQYIDAVLMKLAKREED